MKLGPDFLKLLTKSYAPIEMVSMAFKGYDLAFKTDEAGNPVLLFLGKLNDKGEIKGTRYARILKKDRDGNVLKDHWELKGKAS